MGSFEHLPEAVADRLRRFDRARKRRRMARLGLSALALYGLLALTAAHLDRFLFLEAGFRVWLLWAVHGLTGAWALGGAAVILLRRSTARGVAYAFEAALEPGAEERYVTIENVLGREAPATDVQRQLLAQLTSGTVWHVEREARPRPARDRLLRLAGSVVAGVAVLAGLLAATPGSQFGLMMRRFYRPDLPLPKPSYLRLEVAPPQPVVGKGDDLVLQAAVRGRMPRLIEWIYRKAGHSPSRCVLSAWPAQAQRFPFAAGRLKEMSRIQRDLFLYSQSDMASNFCFAVRCGDAQTAVHGVEVVAQPVVCEVVLTVTPPDYALAAGLPGQIMTNVSQAVQALVGSRITVGFRADQAVPQREVLFEKAPKSQPHSWDEAERRGEFSFVLARSTAFEISVANAAGFANRERVRVAVAAREDTDPMVDLIAPPPDLDAVAGELVPFQALAGDDLGVRSAALQYWVNPSPERELEVKEIPVPLDGGPAASTNIDLALDLERTGAAPGDVVLVRLRARDVAGQDGVSRDARIRVLPFTRDENERLRLRALAFLRAALAEMTAGEGLGAPLGGAAADRVKEAASAAGLAGVDWTSWTPLFDLLEHEQHFTDRPRHKEDVRMLRALLWRALRAGQAPASASTNAVGGLSLDSLGRELLPDLCRLRRAKNLSWRLFGLRRETGGLEAELTRLVGPLTPSLRRRLQLFLAAVQDLNEDLAGLNREVRWIDEEAMQDRMGQLNEAAYYVGRGSPDRRLAACRQLREGFGETLGHLRPFYPAMLKAELASRARLGEMHRQALAEAAAGRPSAAWAAEWLAEEGRLMAYNPFLPLWGRCVNAALRSGRDAEAAMRPDAALADLIEQDARRWRRLAFAWENRAALEESSGNTEKAWQLALSAAEEDAAEGADPAPAFRVLNALDVTAELGDAALAGLGLRDAEPTAIAWPAGDPEVLPRRIVELGLLPEAHEALRRASAELHARTAAFQAAGAPVAELVRDDLRLLRGLGEAVELRLRCGPADGSADREELLLVGVREALLRYAVGIRPILEAPGSAGGASVAGGPDMATADAGKITMLHARAILRLETNAVAIAEGEPVGEDEKSRHPILESYNLTRDIRATLARMSKPEAQGAELAAALRERHRELALGYLTEGRVYVVKALAAARAAEAALRLAPPDPVKAADPLAACRDALAGLERHAARAAAGDLQTRAARAAESLSRQAESLGDVSAGMSAAEVSRRLFMLGEWIRELTSLEVVLGPGAQGITGAFDLSGGPMGVWDAQGRLSAERSQRRLEQQVALALQRANPGPDQARGQAACEAAAAWAAFAFGVARSELNHAGGIRVGTRTGDDSADPLLKYLREELIKARAMPGLKRYGEAVNRYLEGFNDFLRY